MAMGSMNLKVSKKDFETRIELVEQRMAVLMDVIDRYERAKQNVDQFMGEEDSNIESMLQRIDENVKAAKKAHNALNETKLSLQETVREMEEHSGKIKETLTEAIDATKSTVEAAIKIGAVL